MSRPIREISNTGVYHIIFRGINKQRIFEEDVDYEKLMDILFKLKNEMKFEIYAYCFMSNHVHLVFKENETGAVSLVMRRLLTKYVMYYNRKYDRSGGLLENRYKSKVVDIDEYFLELLRYIHKNPVKAGLVQNPEEYEWSSYNEYISETDGLVDKDMVLGMMNKSQFKEFHEQESEETFNIENTKKMNDDELRRYILKKYGVEPKNLAALGKSGRDEILKKLKKKATVDRIERVTGISKWIIYEA